MAPLLRCRNCNNWYQVNRTVPDICPHCEQMASWTTEEIKPVVLTDFDRRFLKVNRIASS
jgi:hypothetical protein